MRCASCSEEIRDTAKVCGYCGVPTVAIGTEAEVTGASSAGISASLRTDNLSPAVELGSRSGGTSSASAGARKEWSPAAILALVMGLALLVSLGFEWAVGFDDAFDLDFIAMFQGLDDFHSPLGSPLVSLGHMILLLGAVGCATVLTVDKWWPWVLAVGTVATVSSALSIVWLWVANSKGLEDLDGASGLAPGVSIAFLSGIGLIAAAVAGARAGRRSSRSS